LIAFIAAMPGRTDTAERGHDESGEGEEQADDQSAADRAEPEKNGDGKIDHAVRRKLTFARPFQLSESAGENHMPAFEMPVGRQASSIGLSAGARNPIAAQAASRRHMNLTECVL
jgi:hypothetical protein